jgi:hypothetical protein
MNISFLQKTVSQLTHLFMIAAAVSLVFLVVASYVAYQSWGAAETHKEYLSWATGTHEVVNNTSEDPELCTLEPTPLESLTPETLQFYEDRPWRPFRWPLHQTMSIFKLDINHWLDMDKWYRRYIDERQKVFKEHSRETFGYLPESDCACEELLEVVVNHITTRYPKLFNRHGNMVRNLITKQDINISKPFNEHPLLLIGKLVKEDFYVVQQRPDGLHYLVAAAVPFPGGSFTIEDKIGKHLDVIHTEVPYYDQKLRPSMERWFSRLKVNEPVERATFNIVYDHGLFTSKLQDNPGLRGRKHAVADVPFKKFNVRIERQALRRLPKSRAIIFTNHPIFYSVEEMKDEPMIPSILKSIITSGPELIVKYKSFDMVSHHLVPYLDTLIQRQLDFDIITPDQPVRTLPTYPFAHWVNEPGENGWNRRNHTS